MLRFFKYLSQFDFFSSFYLYLTYKQKFLKNVSFSYKGNRIYLRTGTSDFNVLEQVLVNKQYQCYDYIVKPLLIIDAGANIGLSAIFFKSLFKDARIICFEPEVNNFNLLQKNTSHFKNIELVKKGIWVDSTDIYFNSGTSFYDFYISSEPTNTTIGKIPCISIPDIISQFGISKIDILKLDIEGAEKQIFNSNTEWLDKVGCLMIETHDRMVKGTGSALFNSMNNYNFDLEIQDETIKFFNITKKK